jgi:hypothetical protein
MLLHSQLKTLGDAGACRRCGRAELEGLPASCSTWRCPRCELVIDRDPHPPSRPPQVVVEKRADGLVVSWPYAVNRFPLTLCLVVMGAALPTSIQQADGRGEGGGRGSDLLVWFLVAATLLLGYSTAVSWINRRRIVVQRGVVRSESRPLPWTRATEISREELRELFCVTAEESNRLRSWRVFEVHALRRDGRVTNVVGGLKTLEHARWLLATLEGALGLTKHR